VRPRHSLRYPPAAFGYRLTADRTRRREFYPLFVHHLVALALVALAWHAQYLRIGLLVMYVHDASDLAVDVLKLVCFLGLGGRRGHYAAEAAFAAAVVSWGWWRLWIFPTRVMRSTLVEVFRLWAPLPRGDDGPFGLFPRDMPWYTESNALLAALMVRGCALGVRLDEAKSAHPSSSQPRPSYVVLQALHVFWFVALLRTGARNVRNIAAGVNCGQLKQ
jgi:hypothetical protein